MLHFAMRLTVMRLGVRRGLLSTHIFFERDYFVSFFKCAPDLKNITVIFSIRLKECFLKSVLKEAVAGQEIVAD